MRIIPIAFVVASAGCLGGFPGSTPSPGSGTTPDPAPSSPAQAAPAPAAGDTSGGTGNTFNHDNDDAPDPFAVLERIQEEGPPEVSTRMHSCQKLDYGTVGNVLASLGASMDTVTAKLYSGGGQAMGAPNFPARVSESIEITTAGATKLFDIFVAAAPAVIAAMPTNQACTAAGAATQMFDTNGNCTAAGVSCLQGSPATQQQIDLCNSITAQATTPKIGQTIAVATVLASAHTCE